MSALSVDLVMKRILAITFLNFFISGGLTLAIPLLLLERNVDLVEIGLVISILPLVFSARSVCQSVSITHSVTQPRDKE